MSSDRAPEGYRRRHRWPALAIIGVLLVATAVTWVLVLKPKPAADNSCNSPAAAPTTTAPTATDPAAGADPATAAQSTAAETTAAAPAPTTTLGAITDKNTLRDTRPASPATVLLGVVNASDTPGMAKTVTESLRRAGFDSIRDAGDDTLYPARDLRCWGEIRYGDAGAQAARTVLIVAPCATLVKDDRFDDSVDFAVGALYTDAALTEDQQAQLEAIRQASTPPAVIEGVTQAAPAVPTTFPLPSATCPS
ncbi:MAG: envelope integrity protein Cei [Nakamurella sp.]